MRIRGIVIAFALLGLTCIAVGISGHEWGASHMRRMVGREDISKVSCYNCHLVSTNRLEWAKPRTHHDSPAGLAISPDGKRIYIALDDRDEVAEADVASRKVLRRSSVPGGPYGLALDPAGKRLFVCCRTADRVAVLDTRELKEIASVAVGRAPVAAGFASTAAGDRLVVANSMSDDISFVSLLSLEEVCRLSAGREPFAVAITPDGSRAFVANRMAGLDSIKTTPSAEVTVLDPAAARVVRREPLASAHLSEGVCIVPSRAWTLTPLVKVRNQVPITQVANGWVMSSGLAITDWHGGAVVQLPLDEANDYFADPSGIVVEPSGRRAFVA